MAPNSQSLDSKDGIESSSQGGPPTKKRKVFDLGEILYEELQSGAAVDGILTTGNNNNSLPVHTTVLKVVSTVFREKLEEQMDDDKKIGVVELPQGTSMEAAKAFIKVFYVRQIDAVIDQKLLLEVLSLCDQFLVEPLLDSCITTILGKINSQNCVEICEASFKLRKCKVLLDSAFVYVLRNIWQILENSAATLSYDLWKKILLYEGPNAPEIEEHALFSHLLKWRPAVAEKQFWNLVPLIRFPLMDLQTIAQLVKSSGALTGDDLSDVICFIIGGGDTGNTIPKFIPYRRKSKLAKNSAELTLLLESSMPGDCIQLIPGEYVGSFEIPEKVTVKGAGPSSTLIIAPTTGTRTSKKFYAAVRINAHDARISDLKIISRSGSSNNNTSSTLSNSHHSQQLMDNQNQDDRTKGLVVTGCRNIVSNVAFENCFLLLGGKYNRITTISCDSGFGGVLVMQGEFNFVSDLTLKNLKFGLATFKGSSGNIIKDVKCQNVLYGVELETNDNTVERVNFELNPEIINKFEHAAVRIFGGSRNKIDGIRCDGHSNTEDGGGVDGIDNDNFENLKYSLVIKSDEEKPESKDNIVTNCINTLQSSVLLGGDNNTLRNVNAGCIILSGKGHRLENCSALRGIKDLHTDNVELKDCNFTFKTL